MRLIKWDDISALLPDAHMELVGDRREVVIYTGWTVADDETHIVPMGDE